MQKPDHNVPSQSATLLFMVVSFAVAVFLASQLGSELKWSSRKSIFAQPGFWSAMSIVGMLICGMAQLALYIVKNKPFHLSHSLGEIRLWAGALEYVLWFLLYVLIVPKIGYLLASIIFCWALSYRLGYRQRKMQCYSVILAIFIVIIFKSFLAVKIPGALIYDYLPDGLRNFMILYL